MGGWSGSLGKGPQNSQTWQCGYCGYAGNWMARTNCKTSEVPPPCGDRAREHGCRWEEPSMGRGKESTCHRR
eukprot:14448504-Heterocapsa_arctica.AAC.1